ncbi:hypothetical protein CDL15_Pgr001508 [Punica granatum]|uniref:Uncharacterized protein n=1 Tax=Punica granatum TaxID=22663 RepID=A0A218X3P2_PUNGR|nr:hypothetical protein CDL15_Pgr001508 [Punica granatum]PKI58337.1 hypothetical protein CRG98_021275 [Punica granatum]
MEEAKKYMEQASGNEEEGGSTAIVRIRFFEKIAMSCLGTEVIARAAPLFLKRKRIETSPSESEKSKAAVLLGLGAEQRNPPRQAHSTNPNRDSSPKQIVSLQTGKWELALGASSNFCILCVAWWCWTRLRRARDFP